ncbi:MAG: ParB/RepB/Spo0J family partition protein [bacterium]|nr:ParB/RepB/Spo0J family partition protein [bacterium]
MTTRKALGKGLDALIPQDEKTPQQATILLKEITVNPEQPRAKIDKASLKELAASIKENGVIQAILVRPKDGGGYELVAGERRFSAAKIAGLREIPADVRDIPDDMLLTLALVENLLREDLNAIEEAKAYRKLVDERGLTHAEIAKIVGKSRPEISNKLRLLDLHPYIQKLLRTEQITAGHARALATIENTNEAVLFAKEAVSEGYSVREIEREILERFGGGTQIGGDDSRSKRRKQKKKKDPYIADLEKRLEDALATKVRMTGGDKTGRIVVNYYSPEDLERILKLLGVGE